MIQNHNRKISEQWADLSKKAVELSHATTKETLTVAAGLLKTLSKELSVLGEKLGKWAVHAEQRAAASKVSENPPCRS